MYRYLLFLFQDRTENVSGKHNLDICCSLHLPPPPAFANVAFKLPHNQNQFCQHHLYRSTKEERSMASMSEIKASASTNTYDLNAFSSLGHVPRICIHEAMTTPSTDSETPTASLHNLKRSRVAHQHINESLILPERKRVCRVEGRIPEPPCEEDYDADHEDGGLFISQLRKVPVDE